VIDQGNSCLRIIADMVCRDSTPLEVGLSSCDDTCATDRSFYYVTTSPGVLHVTWKAANSLTSNIWPLAWKIDGYFTIGLSGDRITGETVSDKFPAYEFWRYPRTDNLGLWSDFLGHRNQAGGTAGVTSLKSAPSGQIRCIVDGPREMWKFMSCGAP
jgi:hypothetical protein